MSHNQADIVIPEFLIQYFDSLENEHGITLTLPQKRWYTLKYKEQGEDIKREYPSTDDEAFSGSSEGFWYLKEMGQARQEGRITNVPYQKEMMVYTAWDVGYHDPTAIWFFQLLRSGTVHIINYYQNSGEGLPHYFEFLKRQKYTYDTHFFPHDTAAHDKGTGLSMETQAKELGMNVTVLQRFNPSKSTYVREIQRVRNLLSRCYFDESKCAIGIKCLENYRKKWNESMVCYTDEAIHDWASHGSDSFRYLSQAVEEKTSRANKETLEAERKKIRRLRGEWI